MKKIFTVLFVLLSFLTNAQWINNTENQHPSYISYGCAVLPNNTVFVTGVEGDINQTFVSAIYKSSNNGASFTIVKSLPGSSCERIKFWNNSLGIAVDNYSLGSNIIKTTDGGNTWTTYSLGLTNNANGNVKDISFLDSTTFYLTAQNKIFKSVNFSNVPVLLNSPTTSGTIDEVQFITSNLGFCSVGKLYKTINGGQDWTNLTSAINGNLESFKFIDANNGIILYSDGTIYNTINGGQSWTKVRVGHGASVPYFYQMIFINPLVGYAVSQQEIIATTNGGQTWTSLKTFGSNYSLQNIHVNKNGVGISTGLPFGNYSYTTNFGSLTTNITVPTATISGFDSICTNEIGSLRFDFTGSGPWNVTYSDGSTSRTISNISATPYFVPLTVTANKTYSITAFSNNGTSSANIFGKAYSKIIVSNQTASISGNKTICNGDSAQIKIRLLGSKPVTFTYTNGITPTTISNYTDTLFTFTVRPTSTTTYTVNSVKDICNNNGSFSGSAIIIYTDSPLPPSNLTLIDSNRKVLIKWIDNSTNEDSIIIERRVQGQNLFSRLKSLLPNTTQYLDTNITYQKWYYYKITFKKNGITCSGISNIDSIYMDYPPSKFPITAFNSYGTKGIRNAVWFDVDNDGDQDIIFGNLIVYKNNGGDNFEYAYSLPNVGLDSTNGSNIMVTDINNDGKTDYFIQNVLINNIKSARSFSDNGNFNLGSGPFDFAFYDNVNLNDNYLDFVNYNNDKRIDIVANYYGVINQPFNPYNGTYRGTDVYQGGGQSLPYGALNFSRIFKDGRQALKSSYYTDYNGDRYQDLIVPNTNGSVQVFKFNPSNFLSSSFEDSGVINGIYSSTNFKFADIDNDNNMDMILAAGYLKKYVRGLNGYYVDVFPNNYGDFNTTNALNNSVMATEDFNNDGWIDIFMVFPTKAPILFLNNKNNTFSKYDFGYIDFNQIKTASIALADYNNDGKVDMFIGNKLLKNTLPFNNNWINIKILPVSTNRIPYGAKIRLKATINGQAVWQQREIYAGSNSTIAHFGLGNATKADSLIIIWPNHSQSDSALRIQNSNVSVYDNLVAINQTVEYIEPTRVLQFLNFASTTTKTSLRWNKITSATRYLLQRKREGDTIFRQVYLGNTINFDDTTLLPNTTYLYKVSALSTNDTISETVYATTNKIELNLSTNNDLSNQLYWNTTTSSTIKLKLYRKQANNLFVHLKDIQGINTLKDSNLIASTQYCYFIQAFYSSDSTTRSNSDTVCVTTAIQSSLSAGADVHKCPGKITTLTASGASSYTWNTGETTASITVSPTVTTAYIVTGNVGGLIQRDTVTIFVDVVPNVFAGSDTSICIGQSLLLKATGADVYSWVNGSGTSNYLVSPNTTTNYIVLGVSNTSVCSKYDTVKVTVKPLPNINFSKVQNNSSVQFTAPNGNTSYNWSFGDATANSTLQNPAHTYASNGKYYIVLNSTLNGCNAQKLDSVTINITAIKNSISFINNIEVFPNPTNSFITINLQAKKQATFNLVLTTIDGRIISQKEYKNITAINDKFDLKDQASGIYFLQINSENEQATYKILKN